MIILALIYALQQDVGPFLDPPIPAATAVKVSAPEHWVLKKIGPHFDDGQICNSDGSLDWIIRGVRIHFPRQDEGYSLDRMFAGRDGSVIYSSSADGDAMAFYHSGTIINPPHKKLIATTYKPGRLYIDAKNYIYTGNYGDSGDILWQSYGPPYLHVVRNKVDKEIGLGDAVAAWNLDQIIVDIPLDDNRRPSTNEFAHDPFLRLYDHSRPANIGGFTFLRSLPNRTLILTREGQIHMWRSGKFLSDYALPPGWEGLRANDSGAVLLFKKYGNPRQIAILRKGTLTEIEVDSPAGLNLNWNSVDQLNNDESFYIDNYKPGNTTHYKVIPPTTTKTPH